MSSAPGLALDILEMESWNHMGYTASMIINDIINVFEFISENVCILLMGWHYSERWSALWQLFCLNLNLWNHHYLLSRLDNRYNPISIYDDVLLCEGRRDYWVYYPQYHY